MAFVKALELCQQENVAGGEALTEDGTALLS